jgi:hypothetical protein
LWQSALVAGGAAALCDDHGRLQRGGLSWRLYKPEKDDYAPMGDRQPLSETGFTDSTTADFASVVAVVEDTYGLAPLGSADASAYDFANAFDFAQSAPPRSI